MTEKQYAIIIRENNNIDRVRSKIDKGKYLTEKQNDTSRRWRVLREYCSAFSGWDTKNPHIVFDERWHLPVSPIKDYIDKTTLISLTDRDDLLCTSVSDTAEGSLKDRHKIQVNNMLMLALVLAVLFTFLAFMTTANVKPPTFMMPRISQGAK